MINTYLVVSLLTFSLLFVAPAYALYVNESVRVTLDEKVHAQKSIQSDKSNMRAYCRSLLSVFSSLLKFLNNHAALLGAGATFVMALIALYLGDWKERFQRPKLKLFFNEKKEYPFFHEVPFENIGTLVLDDEKLDIYRPGFNARIKIANVGRSPAKNVLARVERVVLLDKGNQILRDIHYHPTAIKWSGERVFSPVDIVQDSHFYLDLFYAINETSEEICSFNSKLLKNQNISLNEPLLRDFVENEIVPSEDIFWNVWINTDHPSGVPIKYYSQGKIHIYIIISSDNCAPISFKAAVDWSHVTWNKPHIRIEQGNKFINMDN